MKKIATIISALLLSVSLQAQITMTWESHKMDNSRTGCIEPNASNVPEAVGKVDAKGNFVTPNGKIFKKKTSTSKVGKVMLAAQPAMAPMKEVIGYSEKGMPRGRGQYELSNWFVDYMMAATADLTGKHIDFSITNFGGIRANLPQGQVTVDDVMSIFPFQNSFCYVALKGSRVRAIFERMAQRSMQAVGGVEVVVENRQLKSIKIGGEPLDDEKVYGLATINFLLKGGDGLSLGDEALELIDTGVWIYDKMIPYCRQLTAEGKTLDYHLDNRVTTIGDNRRN